MNPWATHSLGSLLEISKEKIEPTNHPTRSFNYTGLEHIEGHTGRIFPHNGTNGIDLKSTKHVFHKNEILYGKLRPYLNKVSLASEDGICSTEILVLKSKTAAVLPSFVAYYLRSPLVLAYVERLTQGANLPRLSPNALLGLTMPAPPLSEQERIVALLDAAEELRHLRDQADKRTEDLIPAVFHEMFGDPATNPKGWPMVPVSDFVANFQGGNSIASEGGESAAVQFKILKVSAVTWRSYRPEESKPIKPGYEPPKHHVVRKGDLLFSRANTTELVGATVYVFDTPPDRLLSDKLWRFIWKEPLKVNPMYVWSLFLNPAIRRELGRRASGTGGSMKNISQPKVLSMVVPLPPLPLQQGFAASVAKIRVMETQQAESRHRLNDLFQSLLHRAFRGEL